MPAEHPVDVPSSRISNGAIHYAWRHASTACVQAVDEAGKALLGTVKFLNNVFVEEVAEANQERIALNKGIELVSMNSKMPLAHVFPNKTLVNRNANQVRHDFRQSKIMIAFNPYHLHSSFGIG